MEQQPNNPLHGLTLEKILTQLQTRLGWQGLYQQINLNCFYKDPSIKSSLKFLRKTPWAREKVEALYLATFNTKPAPTSKAESPWANAKNRFGQQ
ncbi:VF530 family DNA-binding protein [Pseudoalteromonas fenneropenaei]|uniref:VF530 family DNA-binding protein n=1 Tax=Pseudoalteromonas fenneropenaei TaxID=1737459 RepID=A0ABV7CPD4_9GAMM